MTISATIKQSRELIENVLSDLTASEYALQLSITRIVHKFIISSGSDDVDQALEIIQTMLSATDSTLSDFESWEFSNLLEKVLSRETDQHVDLPCGECRVIDGGYIDDIWHESLIEQIKECYDLSGIPEFICIDWDKTAEACKVDGLGHHFAGYDGEEHRAANSYIFRTN